MKKVFLILILGIFLLQSVFAIDLNVEKISDGESIVLGLESPAIFTLNVTNNGPNDKFLFYTFFGMGIEPSEAIEIKSGESKIVELKVFPRLDSTLSGHVIFPYFI